MGGLKVEGPLYKDVYMSLSNHTQKLNTRFVLHCRPMDQRLQALWCLVEKLPKANYNNLRSVLPPISVPVNVQREN